MRASAIIASLPILGMAGAMALAARSTAAISLEQASAMGAVDVIHSAAAALPIDENGLSGPCKAVTVLYAKGTGESGNMGDGNSPGPAWAAAIRASLGTGAVTVQGINYTADVFGYLAGGSAAGSAEYLTTINEATTQCPSTQLVLGGYSQGAQILNNAAEKLTAAVTARIAAVVLFGSPDFGDPVGSVPSSKVFDNCHTGDIICTGSGGFEEHLNYEEDAEETAAFVVSKVSVG